MPELRRLLRVLPSASELTVEANPETVTPELARELRGAGVNRVSLGAQTFQPHLLRVLERRATPDDVDRAFGRLRDAGFDNLSLDLVYGIPGPEAGGARRRPRPCDRARPGAHQRLRARGEAGHAIHDLARRRARAAGRADGGLLRARRRDPHRRRLPLVRDRQLLPRRQASRAQPRLLARPRLSRHRRRRRVDARRRAPAQHAEARAAICRGTTTARSSSWTTRRGRANG